MLGLFGIIVVQLTLICLSSYWISWDMQAKDERPWFTRKVWTDLVALFGKCRDSVQNAGSRAVAASPGRLATAGRRQSVEVAARPATSVANRS